MRNGKGCLCSSLSHFSTEFKKKMTSKITSGIPGVGPQTSLNLGISGSSYNEADSQCLAFTHHCAKLTATRRMIYTYTLYFVLVNGTTRCTAALELRG